MKLKTFFKRKESDWISNLLFIFIFSFAYSIMLTIGPMVMEQNIDLNSSHIFPFVRYMGISIVFNFFVFTLIPRLSFFTQNGRINKLFHKFRDFKYFFAIIWAFIFLAWIPAFLIFFPGIFSYDIISQTASALGTITDNHHPILHTWLLKIFMQLGRAIFSSNEMGLGILAILQMLALSYAMTRLVCLLKKKNIPMIFVILTALVSAFWFPNACLSITMVKDVPYAAFLMLFACHFTEIVTTPKEYFSDKWNLPKFVFVSFLLFAFRNNGVHIFLFCFFFLFLLKFFQYEKKIKIRFIVFVFIPIIMHMVYTGPVFSALHIKDGQVREALSIPIQQLQCTAINKEQELTEEQTYRMSYYIDDLSWTTWATGRMYDPFFADPAKSCFYSDHYNENPIAFWKFYLQIGMQFPKEYSKAFLSNTLGFWYPNFYRYSYIECDNYSSEVFMANSLEPLQRSSIWETKGLTDLYRSLCYTDGWRQMPVIRLFFAPGFTLWFLLYGMAMSWKKRGYLKNTLPIFLPLIGQYGIMLLSPMSSFRYAWPFYLMLPLVFIGVSLKNEKF